jgi:RNA polymerase sigma factor (sigma-70 family)
MRTEDGFIIQKCLNGEPEAFGLLVDKYKASIYAFVYAKLRNFHDAEDVTQETFIKAYRKLRDLRKWDSFLAWLYCIASDKCRKFIRSQSARPDREFIEDQNFKDNRTVTHSENVYDSLHDALDSLPEIYCEVLTLHYLGGMSTNQIANFLRVSPEAIRQRLSRARTQLKEEVLAIMSGTLSQHRLQASFTFRVVEILKKIKIHPTSEIKGLPWGVSLGAGLIFAILMFGQHIPFNLPDIAMGFPLPSDTKILKVGEIPVDAVKVSTITSIASKGDGKGFAPDPKGQENAFFMAPQAEGEWTKRADMPTARWGLSTSVVNGKIYAIGGTMNNSNGISAVEEYDPATDTWTKKTDMPTTRAGHSASVVNGKIYVIGGARAWGDSISTVEEYDPTTDKWTKRTDMPTARSMLCSSVVDDKIYVIGGSRLVWGDALSIVEKYDPVTDTWTKKTDMPTARGWLSASALNGKIYVFGGENGSRLSTVEEYDPKTDKWTKKADMPTARNALSTSTVDGKIYAVGGVSAEGTELRLVEEYDPVTDTWIKKADMLFARDAPSTGVIDGKIYVFGGYVGGPISAVEEYDTSFTSESVEPSRKLSKTWGMLKAK